MDDTSLMRLILRDLVERYKWTYAEAMERFYTSKTCSAISDEETGLYTAAPWELVRMFEEEISLPKP